MKRRDILECAILCGAGLLGLATVAFTANGSEGGIEKASPPLGCDMNSKIDPRDAPWTHFGWQKHGVFRLGGSEASHTLDAQLYFIGGEWEYNNSQMPYLAYMPEHNRLMLAASVDKPVIKAMAIFSDDFGQTWTKPAWMHIDATGTPDVGAATQLTYLGDGKLIIGLEHRYWFSNDCGQTWSDYAPVPPGSEGKQMYQWDPMLVDRDAATNRVVRLVETRYKENGRFDTPEYFSQGCVRFSVDEGTTWSKEINVPQWKGVNEIVLCRAKNGDIVAACRTDVPAQFLGLDNDQFGGLATSVSKDNGYTWSALNRVYSWGRHHPHLVTMPGGDVVMTYVVRNGYIAGQDGLCRFGIEAVVSRDNGETWDLDHKYILASNNSPMKGDRENWGSPQSTSSVILPDGSLLTAFGTGVRNVPAQTLWKMDVVLVRWRLSSDPVGSEDTIRKAPYESDLRNMFDLDSRLGHSWRGIIHENVVLGQLRRVQSAHRAGFWTSVTDQPQRAESASASAAAAFRSVTIAGCAAFSCETLSKSSINFWKSTKWPFVKLGTTSPPWTGCFVSDLCCGSRPCVTLPSGLSRRIDN